MSETEQEQPQPMEGEEPLPQQPGEEPPPFEEKPLEQEGEGD